MKSSKAQHTLESMSQAVWYNKWTLQKFEQFLHGEILEVGCGIGNFTKTLAQYGNVWAIDIEKEYIIQTKQSANGKVKAGFGDIEKGKYFFGSQKFDIIISLNVLEHIQNDMTALKNMYDLLKDGGKLILLVPAHNFLYGEIDRSIGHFRRYEKEELIKMLESLKFKINISRMINFIGALGWLIAGKIFQNKSVKVINIKIFNFFAPFILRFENLIKPSFGISILIVAEK
ncbi:class I SAM-dependent methyltransferase [Patescibacteria group bacterium]|nr:class I SAM-dependent methyltransferase [Patescibacteria group bacterium]